MSDNTLRTKVEELIKQEAEIEEMLSNILGPQVREGGKDEESSLGTLPSLDRLLDIAKAILTDIAGSVRSIEQRI